MIWFRNVDRRWPFLWESEVQPPARWHGHAEGPAHYLADTPDGAWAEFLRHEEIVDRAELAGIERHLWAVEVPDSESTTMPRLPASVLRGGLESYPACQAEARRLRARNATALQAPTAALVEGGARGAFVRSGLVEGDARDGSVLVLFGERPDLRGWLSADEGRPTERLLALVRPL